MPELLRLDLFARRRSLVGYALGIAVYALVVVAMYPAFKHSTSAGWPGAFQPPAPTDPDVKVSLYPAPLTRRSSKRMGPLPLGEQAGLSRDQPVPPPLEPFVGP